MPVNSPVTSFTSLVLSLSDLNDALIIYSSILSLGTNNPSESLSVTNLKIVLLN